MKPFNIQNPFLVRSNRMSVSFNFRSNLSIRFEVTDQALIMMSEWPDVTILTPLTDNEHDDEVRRELLNRTEFQRQLDDFR